MDDLPSDAGKNLESLAVSQEAVATSVSGGKKGICASPAEPTSEAKPARCFSM